MKLVATYNNDQRAIQKWIIFKQPQFQGSYVRRDKQSVAILTNAFPTVVYVMEVLRVQMALMNQRSFAQVCKVIPHIVLWGDIICWLMTVDLIHSIEKVGNLFRWWKVVGWYGFIFCLKKQDKIYLYSSKSNNIQ